jgi:hypothetical protein
MLIPFLTYMLYIAKDPTTSQAKIEIPNILTLTQYFKYQAAPERGPLCICNGNQAHRHG